MFIVLDELICFGVEYPLKTVNVAAILILDHGFNRVIFSNILKHCLKITHNIKVIHSSGLPTRHGNKRRLVMTNKEAHCGRTWPWDRRRSVPRLVANAELNTQTNKSLKREVTFAMYKEPSVMCYFVSRCLLRGYKFTGKQRLLFGTGQQFRVANSVFCAPHRCFEICFVNSG